MWVMCSYGWVNDLGGGVKPPMKNLFWLIPACLMAAPAAQAGPAFMIMRVGWSAGAFGDVREFPSMAACEATAEHISMVRTPGNGTTAGVPGAWKFSFSRAGSDRHEPLISMLCVPDANDLDQIKSTLTEKGWYRGL